MRVAIFIDAANMFYAQRDNRWHIDYCKVLEYFSRDREVFGVYYFSGTPPIENVSEVRKYRSFRRALILIGYTVIDKEVKSIIDRETGRTIHKANLDVEMTLHVLAAMDGYDEAVILSGDSDFEALIAHLRSCGKRVVCVARRQSTALELVNVANVFIDLNEIRAEIEKT